MNFENHNSAGIKETNIAHTVSAILIKFYSISANLLEFAWAYVFVCVNLSEFTAYLRAIKQKQKFLATTMNEEIEQICAINCRCGEAITTIILVNHAAN